MPLCFTAFPCVLLMSCENWNNTFCLDGNASPALSAYTHLCPSGMYLLCTYSQSILVPSAPAHRLSFHFILALPIPRPVAKAAYALSVEGSRLHEGAPGAAHVLSSETLLFQSHIDPGAAANVCRVCCCCCFA